MKAQGQQDAKMGGGGVCPPGSHVFKWIQASYKKREEPTAAGTVGSIMLIAECVDSENAVAIGKKVVEFIHHNRDPESQAGQIAERTLADYLANTPGKGGKSLHDTLQDSSVDYWFTRLVIEKIELAINGNDLCFKATTRLGKDQDGRDRAEFASVSPIGNFGVDAGTDNASGNDGW